MYVSPFHFLSFSLISSLWLARCVNRVSRNLLLIAACWCNLANLITKLKTDMIRARLGADQSITLRARAFQSILRFCVISRVNSFIIFPPSPSRFLFHSLYLSYCLSRGSAFPLSETRIRCRYGSCDVRTRVYVWWVACHDMTHCIIHSHAPFARWSDGLTYWLNFDSQRLETWWERHFMAMSPDETRYLILQTMFAEFRDLLVIVFRTILFEMLSLQ